MTRQYFYLTQVNIRCKNRYKRLINICFLEFEKFFARNRIYEDTALNFIKAFPHAYIVREKRIDALYNNLRKVDARHDYYYESLTACSTKILRMLYTMCKNNKRFLEE